MTEQTTTLRIKACGHYKNNSYLLYAYYLLSTLHVLSLVLSVTLWVYFHHHFTDQETKA